DVGHIVAFRLQPIGEWKFPEKPFAGANRKRRVVENLTIFSVGPIETDLHVWAPIPMVLAIVVERELVRPAIVSLPRRVRALEKKIRAAIIAHDENHVALQPFA